MIKPLGSVERGPWAGGKLPRTALSAAHSPNSGTSAPWPARMLIVRSRKECAKRPSRPCHPAAFTASALFIPR